MTKPLGLPVGSVRAMLLLGLSARAVLDLQRVHDVGGWLIAAIVVSACAYFASRRFPWRSSAASTVAPIRPPLGLPAGTVRFVFLAIVGYGAWRWSRDHDLAPGHQPIALVVAAFWIGVMVGFFMNMVRRPDDPSTLFFDHLQAVAAVLCAGGLVWLGVEPRPAAETSTWLEPGLAAACTYYAGVR